MGHESNNMKDRREIPDFQEPITRQTAATWTYVPFPLLTIWDAIAI